MDYEAFKVYVRMAGLEIKEFASLVGMNQKSISNYSKRGTVPEHLALMALMMVELARFEAIKEVFAKFDKHRKRLPKRRGGGYKGRPRQAKAVEQ